MSNPTAHPGKDHTRSADLINLGLAALLWAYTIARAYRLSFTHDESVTFLDCVLAPLSSTLRYDVPFPPTIIC